MCNDSTPYPSTFISTTYYADAKTQPWKQIQSLVSDGTDLYLSIKDTSNYFVIAKLNGTGDVQWQ